MGYSISFEDFKKYNNEKNEIKIYTEKEDFNQLEEIDNIKLNNILKEIDKEPLEITIKENVLNRINKYFLIFIKNFEYENSTTKNYLISIFYNKIALYISPSFNFIKFLLFLILSSILMMIFLFDYFSLVSSIILIPYIIFYDKFYKKLENEKFFYILGMIIFRWIYIPFVYIIKFFIF